MLVSEARTALKRYGFDDNDPIISWLNEGMHQLEVAHGTGLTGHLPVTHG